jgi:8-oxo-dGTP diphosphatase
MPLHMTLGHIINGDSVLLKEASRGISKGKWNGPGGKLEPGETPRQCMIREAHEETGLTMQNPFFHGKIYFYMYGRRKLTFVGYLFSTRKFKGKVRSTEEGVVRWFKIKDIPYEKMWDDDKYWINLMLAGRKFDMHFYYDRLNKRVKESRIIVK